MNSEGVKVLGAPSGKKRWGLNFFYRQEGMKYRLLPRRAAIAFGLASALALIAALFQPAPENNTTGPSSIDGPSMAVKQEVDVPATLNERKVTTHQDKSLGRARPVGMSVLKRYDQLLIPPGSMFTAKLLNGASNGLVRAEVTKPLVVNGEEPIPKGATILGLGSSTEERLYISFNQLVLPDGSLQVVQAVACDPGDKMVGLKGEKLGSYALKLGAAIGLNFMGGMAMGLQDSQMQHGIETRKPSLRNALLNGAATASLEQGRETMGSMKNDVPIIEVPAGSEVLILVQGEG